MALEIDMEEEACTQALALGVISKKMKAAGENGWPDRQFFIPGGQPLFIEFKRPGDGVLSSGQRVIIRRLRYYGYQVEVCDTVEDAIWFIKKALSVNKKRGSHARSG